MEILEHVPLSSLTTFRIGGPARFVITIDTKEELPQAAAFAKERGLPLIPLGGGSNMLAPDGGVEAVFVKLRAAGINMVAGETTHSYVVAAGASWDAFVAHAVTAGSWGVENLSAIPGTVGAAAVQNIGAYGAAFSDAVHAIEAYDLKEGVFRTFSREACAFGYRTSVFKKERDRYFITEAGFHLSREPKPDISYRDLATRFAGAEAPTLADIRAAVIAIRAKKFPPLAEYGTAGSFFLNPIITEEERSSVTERFPGMPLFDMPEGGVKLPLGWILDRALALKGYRHGGAFLWHEQTLVIAADRGASSADVAALADDVRQKVSDATGIMIEPEVRMLGASS